MDSQVLAGDDAKLARLTRMREDALCREKLGQVPKNLTITPLFTTGASCTDEVGNTLSADALDGLFCTIYFQIDAALKTGDAAKAKNAALLPIQVLSQTGFCPTESAFLAYKAAARAYPKIDDVHLVSLNILIASCTEQALMLDHILENATSIADAAAYVLEHRTIYEPPAEALDYAASQLGYTLVVMPSDHRERWARAFLSYLRDHSRLLEERGYTLQQRTQIIAVAKGLTGDWRGATTLYQAMLSEASVDQEWLKPTAKAGGEGLMNIITWPGRIRDEAITSLAMAGEPEEARCLFEHPQIAIGFARACSAAYPRRLVREPAGDPDSAVIRVLNTNLGTLVMGYRPDQPTQTPRVEFLSPLNSMNAVWRIDGSSRRHLLGVIQMTQAAEDIDPNDPARARKMHELFDAASGIAADLLADSVLRMTQRLNIQQGASVAIVPTGAMGMLPLVAARRHGQRPLGALFALRIATDGEQNQDAPIALPTTIRRSGGSRDLPATKLELATVAHWAVDKSVEFTSLNELGGRDAPRIIHISNHAGYRPAVEGGSAILLSGGHPLTLAEISQWKPAVPPRLVILSGCQTGLVEFRRNIRDQHSLAKAFLLDGVTGVVASSWPVDDLATALLMARFYDLLATGASPRQALYQAQAWISTSSGTELGDFVQQRFRDQRFNAEVARMALVRIVAEAHNHQEQPIFADPVYWAGFQLFGR